MKRFLLAGGLLLTLGLFSGYAGAQTDDLRQATGLPIPIGAQAIYGQINIHGLPKDEPKPSIFVSLIVGGAQLDRMQPNDRNFYYFLRAPINGATLVLEINNSEAGRMVLSAGTSSSLRQDIDVNWPSAGTRTDLGVVSVKNSYVRTPPAEKAFDKALAAAKAKKTDEALTLYKEIVDKDPKDFVAWTEMGTLYFGNSKFAEAQSAYAKALEQKPDFMPALMNAGKLCLSQKQFEKAIFVFLQAANTEPTFADAFHYLGEAYLQAKQGAKAVIALNEAIRLEPIAMAEIHLRLAALYDAAGVKDRAAAEYKMFLEKRPNYVDRLKLEAYIKTNGPK